MSKQNKKLLENIKKYEEKQTKQSKSKILEQRKIKDTESQRKETTRYYG